MDSAENIRRFRPVVQHLNMRFAENMRLQGHEYTIGPNPQDGDENMEIDQEAQNESDDLESLSTHVSLPSQSTSPVMKLLIGCRGFWSVLVEPSYRIVTTLC